MPLAAVLDVHASWLDERGLRQPGVRLLPVTWGGWDLAVRQQRWLYLVAHGHSHADDLPRWLSTA